MADLIATLNRVGESWLNIIARQSLQLTLVFMILFALNLLLRKKSPVFLYSIWTLFIFKAILLPVIKFPLPQHSAIPVIPFFGFRFDTVQAGAASQTSSAISLTIPSILFILWLCGIAILLFLYIRNERLFFTSLSRSLTFIKSSNLHLLKQRIGILKPIRLCTSPDIPAPFTKGFRKPVIYLPESASRWKPQQMNHVLCHELAHIKRRDILTISVQNVLNILYFFHPLVWLANHQINFQREKICDATAIQLLGESPAKYGRTLMDNLESYLVHHRLPLIANGLFFSKKTIIRRFEYLFNFGKELQMKLGIFQKITLVFLSIILIVLSCNNQNNNTPVNQSDKTAAVNDPKFVPYDSPPEPIGGFAAIQKAVVYPQAEKEAGHEGTVVVQTLVDKNGDVSDSVTVLISPGFKGLEKAAMEAIKKVKFKPAEQNGEPVGVYISIPVVFKTDH